MTAPGWHYAQGDPPGTQRYWDGDRWIGDPVPIPGQGPAGGYGGAPGGYQGGGYQGAGYPGQSRHANLASPGARMGGRLIDFIIIGILSIILVFPLITNAIDEIDRLGPNPTDRQVERVITDLVEDNIGRLLAVGAVAVFWDFLWVALAGGTPGKLMLGMRVARADNGAHPPGFGKAALRALNRVAGFIPFLGGLAVLIAAIASLIMLFTDDEHRTVMDRIAGTVVIKK